MDLGQIPEDGLTDRYGIDETLATKLEPYRGKTGNAAVNILDKNPLTLTKDEAKSISEGAGNYYYKDLQRVINAVCKPKFKLLSLSYAQRTAISSIRITLFPSRLTTN